jgi:integral membrane protein (TIGR00529 family)
VGVDRSRSAAINFLFRHQWETVWPLFPAVPLIQGMLGISALKLISHNIAIMLGGTLGGIVFLLLASLPPKNARHGSHPRLGENLRHFAHAMWPIALVAGLYAGADVPPAIGILLAIFAFLLLHGVRPGRWARIFKSGLQLDFGLLVLGALLFKLNLEAGRAIPEVVRFLTDMHVPPLLLIFLLPFLVGFLTGVTMPSIAITFPFLLHFIGTGSEAKIGLETLAFSGLICGLLLTPVHLCMALSASYFEAPLTRIIPRLLGPAACVAGAGFGMAIMLG